MSVLVKAHSLSKSWITNPNFSKIQMEICSGRAYVLHGDNGSGKSTLLRILAQLLVSDSGTLIFEKDLRLSWFHSAKFYGFERLTGKENILMFQNILGRKVAPDLEFWISHLHGFKEALEKPLMRSSDGMKSMISMYMSCMGKPDVLIWDEPFSFLSQENRNFFSENWSELTQAKSLCFSSHEKKISHTTEVFSL